MRLFIKLPAAALALLLCGFQGCETDLRPRSRLELMTVVAAQADPPEGFPTETQRFRALVASPDPLAEELDYAFIACTSYTGVDGCLEEVALATEEDLDNGYLTLDESEYRTFFQSFVRRGSARIDGLSAEITHDADFEIPLNYYVLLTEFGYSSIQATMSVLVCRKGLCPIMDELDLYLAGDPAAMSGPELMTVVSNPGLILSGAPIDGVSLGRKSYQVSLNDLDNRNQNPEIVGVSLEGCDAALAATALEDRTCEIQVELPEDVLEIYYPSSGTSVTAQEALVLRFFTTSGEVLPPTIQIYASTLPIGGATLQLAAPEETPDEIGIYVVAEDSRTGMAYASTSLDVR